LNLVYPDGQLERMYHQPARRFDIACENALPRGALRSRNGAEELRRGDPACTWPALVAELRWLLETTKPDIVLCPHPILDAHPDHVFTTVALEQAVRAARGANPRFFLYVVHVRDVPAYPFGDAGALVSLPPSAEDYWSAESIYSHPLAPDVQSTKYFAVEAVHDDRAYSSGEARTVAGFLATVKRELSALLGGTGIRPTSFLRRAPRPNEVYYVVSAEALSQLVRRALAHHPAPRG
jgi:hypothetical protein